MIKDMIEKLSCPTPPDHEAHWKIPPRIRCNISTALYELFEDPNMFYDFHTPAPSIRLLDHNANLLAINALMIEDYRLVSYPFRVREQEDHLNRLGSFTARLKGNHQGYLSVVSRRDYWDRHLVESMWRVSDHERRLFLAFGLYKDQQGKSLNVIHYPIEIYEAFNNESVGITEKDEEDAYISLCAHALLVSTPPSGYTDLQKMKHYRF